MDTPVFAAPIRLLVEDDHELVSQRAADWIADEIRRCPELLLGAATGSTPTRTYQVLCEKRTSDPHLFDRLRVVKLDEWGGLATDDPATCEAYVMNHLIGPLAIAADRYIGFRSDPEDPQAECMRVRSQIERQGPIDICVLGLGINGHLALNEPARVLEPFAHVVRLAATSLEHPMLMQSQGEVRYGLTVGLSEILASRRILLLVTGRHKRRQMQRLFVRQISMEYPASLLWLHRDVTCLCDREAASQVESVPTEMPAMHPLAAPHHRRRARTDQRR